EAKQIYEIASRLQQRISAVMRYAVQSGIIRYNPALDTVNKALRVMGYDTTQDVCGHGFRAMACSALIESGLW
ncbi:phage integrase central domain-containing protein, partial [Escherichia coli]|uniref:phage integrase central domain-containing protein n=1 Tax=Escherichia coli TaxID=562 RepID=UPI003C6D854E